MDYHSPIFDPNKITENETDDFSVLLNEQMLTHSKLMDTNLDDIEMNDELLDKLVTALLQDNTLNLQINSEDSNLPTQSRNSCNHGTRDPNSTIGVSDNTLQSWQKLLEGDDTVVEFPQMKSNINSSINLRSALQTPRPLVRRISEDVFQQSLSKIRSQLIRANTPRQALPRKHFEASPHTLSSSTSSCTNQNSVTTTNSQNRESSCSTGPMTRSRSASNTKQSDSHSRPTITPDSNVRYHLRSRNSSGSQSRTNMYTSQSRITSKIQQTTPKESNFTSSHKYQTRSRTGTSKTKVRSADQCCTKLAVVIRRARMSMIARLRCRRSSVRLPTPTTRPGPRMLPTPKTKLEPRRLYPRKAKISAFKKNSRDAPSMLKRFMVAS